MTGFAPSWFKIDSVFRGMDGWYVGSAIGFRIGPYATEAAAAAVSDKVQAVVARSRNRGEMLRGLRHFLNQQAVGEGAPGAGRAGTVVPIGVRRGEHGRFWARTDRCFNVDGAWFFSTREGVNVGPYGSRRDAERDVKSLISQLKGIASEEGRMLAIHQFMLRPVAYRRSA